MKITKSRLKEIILEELSEMYVTDIAGSDEDRAIDRHRAAKRARGQYPPRHGTPKYVDDQSPEDFEQKRTQAMVQATKNILKMSPDMSLIVDQGTYDAMAAAAPELMDRISVRSRRRE